MKLAVDSFSYHLNLGKHWYVPKHPKDIFWYCHMSKYLGLNGLHIDPAHIRLEKDVPWLIEFLKKNNMYIELGAMEITNDFFHDYLIAAKHLGSKILRTFVGGSCHDDADIRNKLILESKKKLLKYLPLAEKLSIAIAVENHIDITLEELYQLIDDIDSPYVGVCYDSGNFVAMGEDPLQALEVFKHRILCTHLKDACSKETFSDASPYGIKGKEVHFCPLGDGIVPLKDIIKELIVISGNTLNITLEVPTPLHQTLDEPSLLQLEIDNTEKSVSYVRNLCK